MAVIAADDDTSRPDVDAWAEFLPPKDELSGRAWASLLELAVVFSRLLFRALRLDK